jgi:outer membrane receptor protein involved in Fe transport
MQIRAQAIIICAAFIVAINEFVLAQEKNSEVDLYKLSLEELGNVVITPSKFSQSIGNVTQKIDIINSKEIESSVLGNENICEVIKKLPGASVTVLSRNDANWGTYGGIGPKYSTYMLQGLPIDAFVDPMSLDLNAIDHIEVQRGPASVFYPNFLTQDYAGSQSPLCGTVNLILKQKIAEQKTSFQSSFGSYNTLNTQVYHQNKIGRLNYFLGSTYEVSNYTNYGTSDSWLNMKKDPEYKKSKIYGGLTLFIDEDEKQKFSLFIQKTFHNGDKGRIYQVYDFQYGTLNAGYEIAMSDELNLQSHFGIRSYEKSWQESNFGIIDTLKSNSGVNEIIIPVDISLSWNHGGENIISVGADFQNATYYTWNDPLIGYKIFGNKSSAIQGGIYAQEELHPADNITLRGGLRYAYIKNMIELVSGNPPADDKKSWENILWSFGARYNINLMISFYANAGTGFATPALKSTAGTIPINYLKMPGHDGQLPNPNLKAEYGTSIDAGIEFTFEDNYKIGIRGFYTTINDAIVDNIVSRNPSQSQSINTGSSNSTGGEIELSHKLSEGVSWWINGTLMSTDIINEMDQNQNEVEIPFAPKFVFNAGINYYSSFGLTLIAALNFNDGFYDAVSKIERNYFKPGLVINVYIAQEIFKSNIYSVEGFTQLYNLTDNRYDLPWQFKNPGFSGMFGIKVTF